MRGNPDGSLSSAGASRAPALFPAYRWDLSTDWLLHATLGVVKTKSWPGGDPGQPCHVGVVQLGGLLFSCVHRLDLVGVSLRDHLALDLQGRRDLAGLFGEGAGQGGEVLDRL